MTPADLGSNNGNRNHNRNRIPKTTQPISDLGFGAYRISPYDPVHANALHRAATSGHVNVIDTAAHFGDGASESAIGQLLKSDTGIDRSSLCIISKAGFVTPHIAQVLAHAQVPTDHVAGISPGRVGHSISPAAIKAQLDRSLQQLGTDYIDMYMINCPERLLAVTAGTMPVSQLESSLARSIEYLASEVDRGRIRGFGFTSTDAKWALPTGALKAALGHENPPQWHGVQVPANICETSFLAPDFLDKVNDYRLALFTHRLLTAISPLGILRLATTINPTYHSPPYNLPLLADPAVAGDLDTAAVANLLADTFPRLTQLEETLVDQVDDPDLANKFIWSGVLTDTLEKLLANDVGATHFFTNTVLPTVHADIAALHAAAGNDAKTAVANWAAEYVATVEQVKTYVTALAHAAAVVRNRESRDLLTLYAPGVLARVSHLPEISLQLVHGARRHVPGSTLVGMRKPEYVERMVAVAAGGDKWVERDGWERIRESGVLEFIAEGGGGAGAGDRE